MHIIVDSEQVNQLQHKIRYINVNREKWKTNDKGEKNYEKKNFSNYVEFNVGILFYRLREYRGDCWWHSDKRRADVDVADTGTDAETDVAENDAADIVVDTDSTEDLFCLLDVPILEMPDLAGTTWSFCGGNLGGVQMTQEDYDAALEQYGGKLEIVFSDDGSTVQMVQGGGTLDGVCEYHYEDEGVRLTFDNNGTDLVYACVFADFDGLTMVALSDTSGYNAVYFVQ